MTSAPLTKAEMQTIVVGSRNRLAAAHARIAARIIGKTPGLTMNTVGDFRMPAPKRGVPGVRFIRTVYNERLDAYALEITPEGADYAKKSPAIRDGLDPYDQQIVDAFIPDLLL